MGSRDKSLIGLIENDLRKWRNFVLKYPGTAGMMAKIYNPSTLEVEVGGSWVPGHPGLYIEMLSQNKQMNKLLFVKINIMGCSS
jgi:hypothetical protein